MILVQVYGYNSVTGQEQDKHEQAQAQDGRIIAELDDVDGTDNEAGGRSFRRYEVALFTANTILLRKDGSKGLDGVCSSHHFPY